MSAIHRTTNVPEKNSYEEVRRNVPQNQLITTNVPQEPTLQRKYSKGQLTKNAPQKLAYYEHTTTQNTTNEPKNKTYLTNTPHSITDGARAMCSWGRGRGVVVEDVSVVVCTFVDHVSPTKHRGVYCIDLPVR